MDLGIRGKKALVTGASSGLGAAAAMALAAEGVDVTINSRSKQRLEATAAKIHTATDRTVRCLVGDISVASDLKSLVQQCGPVDILVSNAGGPPQGLFEDHPPETWLKAAELTLYSAINLTRALLPSMVQKRWGRLIYITSVAVLQPVDDLILSNTFRAGVTGFCKSISNTYAKHGITANCVCPGYTATERLSELAENRAAKSGKSAKEILDGLGQGVPAGRLGKPEELAAMIAFLSSEQAAYITGCSIPVDGGAHKFLI
ncbi:MAG: SDR family oxidoreductase [Candidatus Zixiibacteriota bacterium]